MDFEKLKTTMAKLRYGELMVATAGAILLAVFSSMLDPGTLIFLDATDRPAGFSSRVLIWGVSIVFAAYMLKGGFRIIDRKHGSEPDSTVSTPVDNLSSTYVQSGGLNIQVSHGDTYISIIVKRDDTK